MLFSQAQRETVKAENPDVTFGQIGKLLGQKWKELTDEEKEPYNQAAARCVTPFLFLTPPSPLCRGVSLSPPPSSSSGFSLER